MRSDAGMLCLVTDRRRLAPDAPFETARKQLARQARWATTVGIDLIQIRERDLDAAALAGIADAILHACRGTKTRVLINDRLDVAMACGADGVHLREDSMPAESVRRITPPRFLISRSVHNVQTALAAGPVDYLIAGTVFATASKPPSRPTLGLDGLAGIARTAAVPVLGIGGMTLERRDDVARSGAAGVAGIGLFIEWFDRQQAPS